MTEKQPKAKSGLRRFAGDMVYSLAGLMILNMTLSFGVYPFLRSRMGAEGSGKMLFFTAIMGLMASAVGSGINYGRMKASTRHETKNGDYNRFLVFTALLCAIVTVVAICVKKDTAGALPISIGVLIFVTTVRYYADVEYRLSLNYRGFFFYYLFIAVGYAIGMALYGISHSWVSIFILGEVFGLLFVTITGSIFKKPFLKESIFQGRCKNMCVTVIGISAVRFCNIYRPCCASYDSRRCSFLLFLYCKYCRKDEFSDLNTVKWCYHRSSCTLSGKNHKEDVNWCICCIVSACRYIDCRNNTWFSYLRISLLQRGLQCSKKSVFAGKCRTGIFLYE